MKNIILIGFVFVFGISNSQKSGTFTDARDGKVYKTVVIGTQMWMAENLNITTFINGDTIPEAKTNEDWTRAYRNGTPASCYFENDSNNQKTMGKLYNFNVISDLRGFAPIGWHIPNDEEWEVLINYLGGKNFACNKMKSVNGEVTYVDSYREMMLQNGMSLPPAKDQNGNNSSGFSAIPSGWRDVYGDFMPSLGSNSFWSKSDLNNSNLAYYWNLGNDNIITKYEYAKGRGFPIRCVKD